MKTRIVFFLLAFLFVLPLSSDGQVGNILRNRINKAVNKKIDEKIDTAVNQSVQDARKSEQEEAGQSGQEDQNQGRGINLGGLMGGKVTSKYNESYSFSNRIYMQMETYDKKETAKMDFFIYFSDTDPSAGIETKIVGTSEEGDEVALASTFIYDGTNKSFMIMTDMGTMKIGIISDVPDESTLQGQPAENKPDATITKTGNSKVIAGYKCDEYLYMENESKNHGNLWVTKDLKLKADKRTLSKAGLPSYYGNPELEDGAVLAMESYNAKNQLEMKSETKEINFNFPHSMSTTGFSFRQMNFNQAQAGK